MSEEQKQLLTKIIVCSIGYAILIAISVFFKIPSKLLIVGYLAVYLYIAFDVLKEAAESVGHRQMMDENFLMAVASLGAFVLGEYSEAVAVILFYEVGEWFQSYAVERSRKSITSLMDIRPEYANLDVHGVIEKVSPQDVPVGSLIVVNPGEKIPLDGVVEKGTSSLDTAALTGESVPRQIRPGDPVISGCINQSGVVTIKTTKVYGESTVAKILDLLENASDKKAGSEKFITRFAHYYTPVVVYTAMALALIPSLITGDWNTWIYRALEFLVISCPCALVVSVPMAFFGGIGGASKCGILVKGSNYLEQMAQVDTMVFDKTGTLTKGTFNVTNVFPKGMNSEELLQLAAGVESSSSHPIAKSIVQAAGGQFVKADNIWEIAGHGVSGDIDGKHVLAGNLKLMTSQNIPGPFDTSNGFGTVVYVAVDGIYAGMIEIADEVKEDAKVVVDMLRDYGVKKFVMLTGDQESVAQAVAGSIGIDEVHAQLLPADKASYVEKLLAQQSPKNKLAFVGDGINDAPVLMQADVGIAMGALGSDAAIEAADIVLMDDQLDDLVTARRIANKTLRISHQNIAFAIGVKFLMLVLGAFGVASMWAAVFADVGVSFLCILNAIRTLQVKKLDVNAPVSVKAEN